MAQAGCGKNAVQVYSGCNCVAHYNSGGKTEGVGESDCGPNIYMFSYEYPSADGQKKTKNFYFKYGQEGATDDSRYCFSNQVGKCNSETEKSLYGLVASDWNWRYEMFPNAEFVTGTQGVCNNFITKDVVGNPLVDVQLLYNCLKQNAGAFFAYDSSSKKDNKISADWFKAKTYKLHYFDTGMMELTDIKQECTFYAKDCVAQDLSKYVAADPGQFLDGWSIENTISIGTTGSIYLYEGIINEGIYDLYLYPVTRGCQPTYYCPGDSVPMPCPKGNYCPGGNDAPVPCAPGYYCPNDSMTDGILCPEKYYCEEGSINPTPCSTGKICPEGSASQDSCPIGAYCKDGKEYACPIGYYCSKQNATEPTPCPGGTTTFGEGTDSPDGCYMQTGNGGTQFVGNNATFYLPNVGIISVR